MLVSLSLIPRVSEHQRSGLCSSRSTEAYHSPKCTWGWVVQDPQRVDDVTIPHKPAYHTYSRWALSGRTFVLAYRDVDEQPEDMEVDIYVADDLSRFTQVGNARIPGRVTDVSVAELTGGGIPDILFHLDSGELKWLDVVSIEGRKANQVFWYGASEIEVSTGPKPTILAKSRLANTVEQFAWNSKSKKFDKIRQYTWHEGQ